MSRRYPDNFTANTSEQLTQDELVANILYRDQLISRFIQERGYDVATECGYPDTGSISSYDFWDMYRRNAIARRVVNVLPMESWRRNPELYDEEDEERISPFEKSLTSAAQSLYHGSYAKSNTALAHFWSILQTADILSGIGRFGIILLGVDDGRPLREPAPGFEEEAMGIYDYRSTYNVRRRRERKSGKRNKLNELIYMRPFSQAQVQVSQWNMVEYSFRWQQPTMYLITLNEVDKAELGLSEPQSTIEVHWSRVVHIVDNPEESPVECDSRLLPVYDRLLDLEKVYGPSAEGFWQGSIPGLAIEPFREGITFGAKEKASLEQQIGLYRQRMKRYLASDAAKINQLAPSIVDPSHQVEVQLDAICIYLGVPKRIFMGSERGELASGQDATAHDDRMEERRERHITPRVICPVIDRLIDLGVLEKPQDGGYTASWPPFRNKTPVEIADRATKVTQAVSAYISGGVSELIDPLDYMVKFLELDKDEAQQMLENAQSSGYELDGGLEEEEMPVDPNAMGVGGELGTEVGATSNEPPNTLTDNSRWSFQRTVNASNCGAGKEGAKGFQPGNTCAAGDGSGSSSGGDGTGGGTSNPVGGSKVPVVKEKKFMGFNIDHDDLKEVKKLGGSTGAVLVEDSEGNRYVKKYGKNADHLTEEYRAEKMYTDMGVDIPPSAFVADGKGGYYKISQFVEGVEFGKLTGAEREEAIKLLQKDFVADATLGNWDVIGLSEDNVIVNRDEDGNMRVYRVDVGGSLAYRAQGTPKGDKWNDKNDELFSMRSAINPSANAVFGSMTDEEVLKQLKEKKDKLYSAIQEWEEVEPDVDTKKRIDNGIKALENHLGLTSGESLKTDDEGLIELDLSDDGDVGLVDIDLVIPGESVSTEPSGPTVKMTPDELVTLAGQSGVFNDKIKYLNPHGLVGDTVYVPKLVGKTMGDPAHQELINTILEGLPSGTKAAIVKVSSTAMAQGQVPKKLQKDGITSLPKMVKGEWIDGLPKLEPTTTVPQAKAVGAAKQLQAEQKVQAAAEVAKTIPIPESYDKFAGSETISVGTVDSNTGIETGSKIRLGRNYDLDRETTLRQAATANEDFAMLTPQQRQAIYGWKSSAKGYRMRIGSNTPTEEDVAFLTMLDDAPQYQGGTVWRGINNANGYGDSVIERITSQGIGGLFTEGTPCCTSRNSGTGHYFAQGSVLMKINLKPNKAAYIGQMSSHLIEDEVTTKPGATYRIVRIVRDAEVMATTDSNYAQGPTLAETQYTPVNMYVELEQVY